MISLEIIYTWMDIIVLCPVHAPSHPQHQSIRALQTIMRLSLSHLSYTKKNRTNIKRRYIAY
ncbi:hypothetical protein C2C93_13430 [Escherichia coli]|uniref:Uncharacterized protein n=1 Tax=Escherichia coli O6:K15:H31 (strain 536 / UPEC) TaxID=362663 RepID=A0A454A4X1_ECOL5|nr:hypothetical protein ECP_1866 [Escherichia coli 536]AUD55439.1 hypothetical protein CDW44_10300 [Escherichia coli]EFJ61782.1 hypothetical protein HMPREF9553_02135 [Escherichia coli MS 200-1]EFN6727562.1 hypothetical protein [Escherichia coli O6:H31]EFN6856710.1 hypothetical protein [Escherichia coli O6]EFN7277980.1 hypothetical protein [Escherichia coli O11:H5]EFN8654104.1 hypothetical protein [Escherichia coli O83]